MINDNTRYLVEVVGASQECISMNWTDSIGTSCGQCLEKIKQEVKEVGQVSQGIIQKCNEIAAICANASGEDGEEEESQKMKLVRRR